MKLSNLLNLFNRKLPKRRVVWCIGIPYTKKAFLDCCRRHEKSDYIDSLEFQYATTDEEILWSYYEPTANKIAQTIQRLKKYGVDIIDLFSAECFKNAFSYSTIILTAHRHRYLESLDFMGYTIEISEFIQSIPKDYMGIVDISSCYSSTFLKQCKQKAIYATYIAAETKVSIKLRLFIYNQTIRYLASHPDIDYLDSFRIIISRIISIAKKEDRTKEEVFLGGDSDSDTIIERNTSVFAPNEIKRGETILVQVYIYKNKNTNTVISEAKRADNDLVERSRMPIILDLRCKDCINITLNIINMPSLSQTKSLIWNDRISKMSFFITIPKDYKKNKLFFSALISQNKAFVGELDFKIDVVDEYSRNRKLSDVISRKFNKVFISYSHLDEQKVKFIAQAYKALEVNYFFDRHYLKAGSVYPLEIQNYIESADLFILCWSENASKSDYVRLELKKALSLAFPQIKPKEDSHLTIHPLVLDTYTKLPQEMKHIYNFEKI